MDWQEKRLFQILFVLPENLNFLKEPEEFTDLKSMVAPADPLDDIPYI